MWSRVITLKSQTQLRASEPEQWPAQPLGRDSARSAVTRPAGPGRALKMRAVIRPGSYKHFCEATREWVRVDNVDCP